MVNLRVAIGIIVDNNCVLLGRRRKETLLAGLWEFPGGKCEADESYQQALHRELHEELGISISLSSFFSRSSAAYLHGDIAREFFIVTAWDGQPHGMEGQELAWVHTTNLSAWSLLPANIALLGRLQQVMET